MTLPLLISVPHAGCRIPSEVEHLCTLKKDDVVKDGDEGAADIYWPIKPKVAAFVTTDIARAIVDMNREENDRRKDGVIKTHTCWDVPIYNKPLPEKIATILLNKYYRPYHSELTRLSNQVVAGIDCHTMAAVAPPVSPDPGKKRPRICISNANGTFPGDWMRALSACFEDVFRTSVSVNDPFKGGYIIREHSREIPWVQLELSRESYLSLEEKSASVLQAIDNWFTSQKFTL